MRCLLSGDDFCGGLETMRCHTHLGDRLILFMDNSFFIRSFVGGHIPNFVTAATVLYMCHLPSK